MEVINELKTGAMDTVYILAGALAMKYAKGWFSNFKWADEVFVVATALGSAYFKNAIVKNIFRGALVVSILGLADKYFGVKM